MVVFNVMYGCTESFLLVFEVWWCACGVTFRMKIEACRSNPDQQQSELDNQSLIQMRLNDLNTII